MKRITQVVGFLLCMFAAVGIANADKYDDTRALFKNAGESGIFFKESYGYALFPNIGEAGLVVGGAYGKGRVYVHGKYVGDVTVKQLSVGFQAGGQDYAEIVFFKDRRALDDFESGKFEFSAGAKAIAITAAANVSAGTNGVSSGASAGKKDAVTDGDWNNGMAVFTIAKGGLMYAAALAGQKFSYKPRGTAE
ncbi:MAG TPA: lipid-binding SYLF domain-containing protein [Steroidobacteraceae bacterium]